MRRLGVVEEGFHRLTRASKRRCRQSTCVKVLKFGGWHLQDLIASRIEDRYLPKIVHVALLFLSLKGYADVRADRKGCIEGEGCEIGDGL
jgi:hypothetical protein